MPIYEYRCSNGHTFEVIQRMADDPVETCEECGAPVERVFHPVAVHFKGSGFYTTDYAKQKQKQGAGDGATAGKDGDSGSSEGGESKGDSTAKPDPPSKAESKSSSESGGKAKPAGAKSD